MEAFVSQYLSEILSFIGGLVGGSFLTFTITRTSVKGGSAVDQSKASAGGDIVGGNKHTGSQP